MQAFRQIAHSLLAPTYRRVRSGESALRNALGLVQSQAALVSDAQRYWTKPDEGLFRCNSHWRSASIFNPEAWDQLGRQHLALYETFAGALGLTPEPARIVEWGCGGGANAVHFAPRTNEFVGVDLSQASLDECARQVAATGSANFVPVLIEAGRPEAALSRIKGGSDLFLCTYVFELLPTPDYGLALLDIARDLLNPGGMALIQIKYRTAAPTTGPRRWNYTRNLANNTTYAIDEFWQAAGEHGLAPRLLTLMPKQPLVNDGRYAYFCLQKAA